MNAGNDVFIHSSLAASVLGEFYSNEENVITVYVEGDDDVPFWRDKFLLCGYENIHAEEVGGCSNLDAYKLQLLTNPREALYIVAEDLDFRIYLSEQIGSTSNRIIHTFGNAIENTMFCPRNILCVLKHFDHSCPYSETQIMEWYDEEFAQCKELIACQIANISYDLGYRVVDNEERLCYDKSYKKQRVDDFVNTYANIDISFYVSLLEGDPRSSYFKFQGHQLAAFVLQYLRSNNVKKADLSEKGLYLKMQDCSCRLIKERGKCDDFKSLKGQIDLAMGSFV